MLRNIGTNDRIARLIIAVVIAGVLALKIITGKIAIILAIIAVILAATAIIGWCGIYTIFGINTCKSGCSCCGTDKKPEAEQK